MNSIYNIFLYSLLLYILLMFCKNIIIGSGLRSVSAATEILQNNGKLMILDIGNEIEDEKKNQKRIFTNRGFK